MLVLRRENLKLQHVSGTLPAQGSSDIEITIENDGTYSGYSSVLLLGYGFQFGRKFLMVNKNSTNKYVITSDAFADGNDISFAILLVSSKDKIATNQLIYSVNKTPYRTVESKKVDLWRYNLEAYVDAYLESIGAGGLPQPYTLPIATSEILGGVKPVAKTDKMTQPVGVDENGALFTQPTNTGSTITTDTTLTQSGKAADAKAVGDQFSKLKEDITDKANKSSLSLGFGTDGLLYIMVNGVPLGAGVKVSGEVVVTDGVPVFVADFSGDTPSAEQFYSWEGRIYDNAIFDAMSNIQCNDGVVNLKTVYDKANSRWVKQIICTGGLFESDNFTCKFKAKFSGLAGSWQNVITYGTGTHWTNSMYSDGVKWPAGGEIDVFEQAGGYSENPNGFSTPTVHYGSGTESGYPNTHQAISGNSVEFTTDEWHDFKFSLKNGYVKVWIDDVLVGENDFSNCTVDNNYLCDYKPFLKPQAFYIDGACVSSATNSHTDYEYNFEVSNFEVYQDVAVECAYLEIYPQMWKKGTELVFPVGSEIYLDRVYYPTNTSNKACEWKSSNENVATVVQGYVKTLKEGTTKITATCGNVSATYDVVVSSNANVPCAKVIAEESVSVVAGKTFDVTSYLYPRFTTDNVTYTSNDNSIATFENGVIKGIKAGQTTVIITCGTKSATISVDVLEGATPVIAYDLSGLVYTGEAYTGETTTLANTGSYGSSCDGTLTPTKGSYYNGNYSTDGYIQQMKLSANVTGLNLRGVAHTVICKGLKIANTLFGANKNLTITPTFGIGADGNSMPNYSGTKIKYGNVTPYDYTLTEEPCNIAVSSDGTTAKLFINGELVISGSDGYSAKDPTVININAINGNVDSFEIYMEQLSDTDLIEITKV